MWVAAGTVFIGWLFWNAQAHGVDPAVLRSSDRVEIRDSGGVLEFLPPSSDSRVGLIFLPGGGIDPAAYAPVVRTIADAGYPAVLVRLPWRVAPTAGYRDVVWNRIAAVEARFPNRRWVLGGHSRGAALAASFAAAHPQAFTALLLIGTTHPKERDLSNLTMSITKVYGSRDCVADSAAIFANAHLLPTTTEYVRVVGANHAQFAWYGSQLGDCSATISRQAQQARLTEIILRVLAAAGATA